MLKQLSIDLSRQKFYERDILNLHVHERQRRLPTVPIGKLQSPAGLRAHRQTTKSC